ncbi:MAG: helix-turn-helix domain-containing protein [Candidatus Micrarchaeota archaeon]|nr:helix-turn-helix domain-containing protein [Candidatus Micrarchaeota archaeon]
MEYCHVCGAPAETEAFLEGAKVWVCGRCVKFGKAVGAKPAARAAVPMAFPAGGGAGGRFGGSGGFRSPVARAPARMRTMSVVDGFGAAVKGAREARKLSAGDLAKKLFVNEKELAKIEREELRPTEAVAKKLERELGIKLLGEEADE